MVLLMLTVTKNDYNLEFEYVMGRERKKKSNKNK